MSTLEFNELLIKKSESLRPYAASLTHDQEAAQDLFQETMYRALANQEKFNKGSNICAWLHIIMKNIFINNYRRQKKRKTIFDYSKNDYLIDCNQPVDSESAEDSLNTREIYKIINRLPNILRSSFILHIEGYKYREIAEEQNEPIGTIKSRIHFARKKLKSQMKRFE